MRFAVLKAARRVALEGLVSAPVKWYAVGVVARPQAPTKPGKGPSAPRYDTVYQESPLTTPLTRAQVQRLHSEVWGGVPVFRASEPPWQRAPEPPSAPDGDDGLAVAGALGAVAGGLWAVFCVIVPFAVCSC